MPRYTIRVNGAPREVDAPADMPLLWVLRDLLGLTGTKYGCGISQCRVCTVHVAGEAVPSCQIEVGDVGEKDVVTIEGMDAARAGKIVEAWIAEDVPQCGYCQPAQVMAAAALLAGGKDPTDEEIDRAMKNICRCGTYQRIRAAIHRAAGAP